MLLGCFGRRVSSSSCWLSHCCERFFFNLCRICYSQGYLFLQSFINWAELVADCMGICENEPILGPSFSPQPRIDDVLCHPKCLCPSAAASSTATLSAATALCPAVAPGTTVALSAVHWYDAARSPNYLLSPKVDSVSCPMQPLLPSPVVRHCCLLLFAAVANADIVVTPLLLLPLVTTVSCCCHHRLSEATSIPTAIASHPPLLPSLFCPAVPSCLQLPVSPILDILDHSSSLLP